MEVEHLATATTDARVWRIGFRPDPWSWSSWEWATDGRFPGRWDDLHGNFRTVYAGSSLHACLLEVLAGFRHDPRLVAELDEIVEDDEDAVWHPTVPPGEVPREWLDARAATSAELGGTYCALTDSKSIAVLHPNFIGLALSLGLADLDAAALKDARPRRLTQAIAAWIYETADFEGVTFTSRHGDDLRLWAVFERPGDPPVSPHLRHIRPEEIRHDSAVIRDAFQMLDLTWQSESKAMLPAPGGGATYTVKRGDTLSAIAARNNVTLMDLLLWNNLAKTSIIYPGQLIKVGGGAAPKFAASAHRAAPQPEAAATPLVPSSFLGFTYPAAVAGSSNENKAMLNASPVPSREEMRKIVANTARSMGVEPSLALAFAQQESGFDQRAVSPANAIGTMQVVPSSGQWSSDLLGRKLNLLDPHDNVTAGLAIIRYLLATSKDQDTAIAAYYQGQYSVSKYGMYKDTKTYVAAIRAHQKRFS